MKIYMKQLRLIILFSILSLSVTVRAMEEQSVSLDTPTGKINGKIGLPDAKKPPIVLLDSRFGAYRYGRKYEFRRIFYEE